MQFYKHNKISKVCTFILLSVIFNFSLMVKAVAGDYSFSTRLISDGAYDSGPYQQIYALAHQYCLDTQYNMLLNAELTSIDQRARFYWKNLLLDNFILEAFLVSPVHEYVHADLAHHYGATDIKVKYFSMSFQGDSLSAQELAQIDGAGVNFQTQWARDKYMQATLENNPPLFTTGEYISNKLTGPIYTQLLDFGDPINYIDALAQQGIFLSKTEMASYYTISSVLSGGFIHNVSGAKRFIYNGEYRTKLPSTNVFGGILYWPEFSVFMNKDNFSLASDFVYRPNKDSSVAYITGYENVLKGNPRPQELSIGLKKKWSKLSLFSLLTTNSEKNYFFENTISYRLSNTYTVTASHSIGDKLTQKQQRQWPFSKSTLSLALTFNNQF